MTEKVVSLRGEPVSAPGEPVSDVVTILEWALAEAKSGNLRAVGVSYVIEDGTDYPIRSYRFAAATCYGAHLENAVMRLVRGLGKWLDD